MRLTRILALTGLSVSLLGTAAADIETSIGAGYTSEYVFRGTNNGDDLFDLTLKVSGDGNLGGVGDLGWSAGLWLASFDGAANANSNELNIYGEVSKSLSDTMSVAVGVTNYSYFGGGNAPDDIEPYVSLGTELAGLSLGAAAYFDASDNLAHDTYYELSVAHEMELGGMGTLGLSAVLGHFDDGLIDTYYRLTASLGIAVSDSITVTPHISHVIDGLNDDETYGGVSVGFKF
ncbi:MAG: hypothetical protein CMP28_13890 [Roseibacillus sp.]|nr:hypothetical protein [Roseibacillus sp.]